MGCLPGSRKRSCGSACQQKVAVCSGDVSSSFFSDSDLHAVEAEFVDCLVEGALADDASDALLRHAPGVDHFESGPQFLVVSLDFFGTFTRSDEDQLLASRGHLLCGHSDVLERAPGEFSRLHLVHEDEEFRLISRSEAGNLLENGLGKI